MCGPDERPRNHEWSAGAGHRASGDGEHDTCCIRGRVDEPSKAQSSVSVGTRHWSLHAPRWRRGEARRSGSRLACSPPEKLRPIHPDRSPDGAEGGPDGMSKGDAAAPKGVIVSKTFSQSQSCVAGLANARRCWSCDGKCQVGWTRESTRHLKLGNSSIHCVKLAGLSTHNRTKGQRRPK